MKLHNTKPAHHPLVNDAGFTLLEIIAVIVILGILAVVAVPRYFDLQESARDRAWAVGVAEVRGRVNGYFAQQVLAGIQPSAIEYSLATIAPAAGDGELGDLGDFTITGISDADGILTITLAGKTGTSVATMTEAIRIPRPGAP